MEQNNKPIQLKLDLTEQADWYDVLYARLRHASDPAQDCDIDLNDTWRRWMGPQKTTREEIIQSVVNGATRLNATISKLNGRKSANSATVHRITSIAVKFNGDPDEITREVPAQQPR